MQEKPYTILIVDDHPLVRAGVRASLEKGENLQVLGECRRPDEALKLLTWFSPQLLILDIMLGPECSLDWLDRFHLASPELKVLIMSGLKEGDKLDRLKHPVVAGFLSKDEAEYSLLQAVRILRSGGKWFSAAMAAQMRQLAQSKRERPNILWTAREKQVLDLVAQAKDNITIARELGLSVHTVRRHLTVIYLKMGVNTRVEALLQWAQAEESSV